MCAFCPRASSRIWTRERRSTGRWFPKLNRSQGAGDDVVNVGKIALHMPPIIERDGLACEDRAGEPVIGHIGTAPGAIDSEVAEACDREPIEMVIGMGDRLIGNLCGPVEVRGSLNRIIDVKRDFLIQAIDR